MAHKRIATAANVKLAEDDTGTHPVVVEASLDEAIELLQEAKALKARMMQFGVDVCCVDAHDEDMKKLCHAAARINARLFKSLAGVEQRAIEEMGGLGELKPEAVAKGVFVGGKLYKFTR